MPTNLPLNFNLKKTIFLFILCDFLYNGLFQQIFFNGKPTYFIAVLYETSVIHVLTSFLLIWVIWYGPILCLSYITFLIYIANCNDRTLYANVHSTLQFFVKCSNIILGLVLILTPIDWFFFIADVNGYLFPDLIVYRSNVYHIIDVFLLSYGIVTWKAHSQFFFSKNPLTKHTVYYCVVLLIVPALLFSFPFTWDDATENLYLLRNDYIINMLNQNV